MQRREILKAAAAAIGLGVSHIGKLRAQSHSNTRKEPMMASLDVKITKISIDHVTIRSQKTFESVKVDLVDKI